MYISCICVLAVYLHLLLSLSFCLFFHLVKSVPIFVFLRACRNRMTMVCTNGNSSVKANIADVFGPKQVLQFVSRPVR